MSQVTQTAEEVFDSITGHDELAVAQHFGKTVNDLSGDPHMLGRALVFVTRRRLPEINDDDARNFAMEMKHKELNEDYFADPDEESEESGKDEPAYGPPPETLPTGAFEPAAVETTI